MSARIARHCPQCGSALARAVVEGRERSRGPDCSFVLYENPACAVAALVVDGRGRVLLVRRALDPCKGEWALPAGFQEIDEQPAATAVREVREEAGLEIRPRSVFDLFLVTQPGRRAVTLAVYLCEAVGGEPTPGDDALEAQFFDLEALPEAIAFDNRERILSHLRADPR